MIPTQPLVSVIMTSYNTEKYISEAIQSILDQTYPNWELLVADDCSTDNTRAIIESFNDKRIKKFHNDKNLNYLRTRNKLLPHVSGQYICLLDSDDKYDINYIKTKLNVFDSDPDLGMCGCFVYLTDSNLKIYDIKRLNTSYEEIKADMINKHQFSGSAVMMKKAVLDTIGGYRDFFSGINHEDYDWYARIVERFKAINIPTPLCYYRQHPQSESKSNVTNNLIKKNSHLLVQKFIMERALYGSDSLERNDIPAILIYINEILQPYLKDSSQIYREQIWPYASRKMFRHAFKFAIKAIATNPFQIQNYKAPIACMKDNFTLRK